MKNLIEKIWDKYSDGEAVILAIGLIVLVLVLALVLCAAGYAITAVGLMWLWNLVMPLIWAGAPKLTFWVSLGLLLICRILFAKVVTISKGSGD